MATVTALSRSSRSVRIWGGTGAESSISLGPARHQGSGRHLVPADWGIADLLLAAATVTNPSLQRRDAAVVELVPIDSRSEQQEVEREHEQRLLDVRIGKALASAADGQADVGRLQHRETTGPAGSGRSKAERQPPRV
jgi:hypothetical protein